MPTMTKENRQYPRLAQKFFVRFDCVPKDIKEPVLSPRRQGFAVNISGGGLRLIAQGLGAGSVRKLISGKNNLSLEFCLPDFQNKISVIGEVKWARGCSEWWKIFSKKTEMGIMFTNMTIEQKNLIIKYIINKRIEEQLA